MKQTILVVEDDPLNRKLFRILLGKLGHEIIETEDGETAIRLARAHSPRLVLMDVQLPGMNGLDITRFFKSDKELRDIPIVAVTSYAMSGDDVKALSAGCQGYISKPIDKQHFIDYITTFLR